MQTLTSCQHERLTVLMSDSVHVVVVFHQVKSLHMSRSAGVQELSGLQRLEVLHMPYTSPHTVTHLAAHLPALRSLDLWCCPEYAHKEAVGQLTLAAATALTELHLHVCPTAADTVRRLQMPPCLQVLTPGCQTVVYFQCACLKVGMQRFNVGQKSLDVSDPSGQVQVLRFPCYHTGAGCEHKHNHFTHSG